MGIEADPEDDLELLEAHLDGALTPRDLETLAGRLAAEPALAAALSRLRAERDVRRAVWASYEPSDEAAEAVAAAAVASAASRDRLRRAATVARRTTAAAAVIALAFAGGWMARGRTGRDASPPVRRAAADDRPFASSGAGDNRSFPVALTDEHGNVVAVQRFDDPQKAREFAEDVDRWQSRPVPKRRPAAEQHVPVSGEF